MITMALRIGLMLFPRVQQLDLTGPYEVFAMLPDCQVDLVARTMQPVATATGLTLMPTTTFETCGAYDVLCVPGGVGITPLLKDGDALDFVRRQAGAARYVTSVCTGALLLGAAGLLRGRRATTHWNALDLLPLYGAEAVRERVVRDGNLITGGGVTAGIDFALTLAGEIFGHEAAQAVQLQLEYAPAPPYNAGTPDGAPLTVVAKVRARLEGVRAEREDIVRRSTADRYH